MDFKDKTCCVIESGIFQSLSHRLARDFKKVYYYRHTERVHPVTSDREPGMGYPDIENIEHWSDVLGECDLWVCFDNKTEILTGNGWRKFSELQRTDVVATKNLSTGKLEYQSPTKYISYPFNGELMSIETSRVNFAVTPNHKMYIRRQRADEFELVSCSDIYGKSQIEFDKSAIWNGKDLDLVTIPRFSVDWSCPHWTNKFRFKRSKVWPELNLPADDFLALVGFYVAEGSIGYRNSGRPSSIEIKQNQGETLKEFVSVLNRLSVPYTVRQRLSSHVIRIHSAQLAKYFERFGTGASRKCIPRDVKELSSRQLKIVWEWYMKGDGYKSGYGCSTISKQLAHDLSEIALKIGYSVSEKSTQSRFHKFPSGITYLQRSGYRLNISRVYDSPIIADKNKWKTIAYNDLVYCVSVPNKTLYVRREGIPIWCGNCPDIHDGRLQELLANNLGQRVFGSRRAEELEINRVKFRELMDEIGLPVPPYEHVVGLDELRERLKEVDDKWIKTNANVRGTSESWHHINYQLSQAHLDKLFSQFGALRDSQDWLIDDTIPNVPEVGYDGICVDGKFPRFALVGVESKDKAYWGKFTPVGLMPKVIRDVNDKLSPILAEYGYRGFFSTEIRGEYLLEPTCRAPSPAGECEQEIYSNLSEMIWAAADGEIIDPIPAAKYCAQVVIISHEMDDATPLPISIPEESRQWVKLYNSSMGEDGQEWVSPTPTRMSEIGSVVGIGNTPEQAIRNLEKHCDGYKDWAMRLEIDMEAVQEAQKELVKAA